MHSAISGKRQACSLKKLGLIIAIAAVFIIVLSVVKVLVVTFFFAESVFPKHFYCEGFSLFNEQRPDGCARCVDPKTLKVCY